MSTHSRVWIINSGNEQPINRLTLISRGIRVICMKLVEEGHSWRNMPLSPVNQHIVNENSANIPYDFNQRYKYSVTLAGQRPESLGGIRSRLKLPMVQAHPHVILDPGGGLREDETFQYKIPGVRLSRECNYTELLLWNLEGNSSYYNCSFNVTTPAQVQEYRNHPLLGVLLTLFALVTVVGNLLVMIAVVRERYLRTVTNYFVVSLAIADTIIGAVVMPFNIVLEMTNQRWYFGRDWCDVWHSFDVLASTASILNLSVISLDRYWAITDPIAYPSKMSTGRTFVLIALVWICSAAISFPAILWWRLVAIGKPEENVCAFTEDSGYLIFSSIISFYIPMSVILFAYYKIYVAATEQTRSLKAGAKVMSTNGENGQVMTLRMHRGGGGAGRKLGDNHIRYTRAANVDSDNESPSHVSNVGDGGNDTGTGSDEDDNVRPSRMISRKWKHFALSRKLSKLAKEQKAAKTLGIVMGVFCICWVPFFVTNVLIGICSTKCVPHAPIVFPIFTWLGYINSGMNPIIYACSMRDFRRAFTKILLCCCPRYSLARSRTRRRNHPGSFSSSSVIVTCGERCSRLAV